MYKVLFCITLLLATGCDFIADSGPDNANTPEEVFRYIIMKPIPQTVSNIECCGDSWQGYQFFMRFKATDDFIDTFISNGYKSVQWDQISHRFELPNKKYDVFEPSWSPEKVELKECYVQDEVHNNWAGSGQHFLLVDRNKNLVYFYGVGS